MPNHERRMLCCELIFRTSGANVDIGSPRTRLAELRGSGLRRKREAETLLRV